MRDRPHSSFHQYVKRCALLLTCLLKRLYTARKPRHGAFVISCCKERQSVAWWLDAGTDRRNSKSFAPPYVSSLNGGDEMSEVGERKIYQKIAGALMVACVTFGFLQLMGWIKI